MSDFLKKAQEEIDQAMDALKKQNSDGSTDESEKLDDFGELGEAEGVKSEDEVVKQADASAKQEAAAGDDATSKTREKNWEQMFRVLQSKYDAEVPRLHQQLKQRDEFMLQQKQTMELLQKRLDIVESSTNQQQGQGNVRGDSGKEDENLDLDPNDMEDYGDEVVKMAKLIKNQSTVIEKLQAAIAERDKSVSELYTAVGNINQNQAQSRQMSLEDQLTTKVSDWRNIVEDQAFVQWLEQQDPMYGYSRYQLFRPHWDNGNIDSVANFLLAFKKELGPGDYSSENGGQQVQQKRSSGLEQLVEPNRTGGSETIQLGKTGKKNWTVAEVDRAYQDKAGGKYDRSPERWNKIEQSIQLAFKEGRIDGTPKIGRF